MDIHGLTTEELTSPISTQVDVLEHNLFLPDCLTAGLSSSAPPQATCVQYRLVVRDVNTLQILHLYTCLDQIVHMEWSSDSLFILCAMYKRGLVQVCAALLDQCILFLSHLSNNDSWCSFCVCADLACSQPVDGCLNIQNVGN